MASGILLVSSGIIVSVSSSSESALPEIEERRSVTVTLLLCQDLAQIKMRGSAS
jgi:hypothetical protein